MEEASDADSECESGDGEAFDPGSVSQTATHTSLQESVVWREYIASSRGMNDFLAAFEATLAREDTPEGAATTPICCKRAATTIPEALPLAVPETLEQEELSSSASEQTEAAESAFKAAPLDPMHLRTLAPRVTTNGGYGGDLGPFSAGEALLENPCNKSDLDSRQAIAGESSEFLKGQIADSEWLHPQPQPLTLADTASAARGGWIEHRKAELRQEIAQLLGDTCGDEGASRDCTAASKALKDGSGVIAESISSPEDMMLTAEIAAPLVDEVAVQERVRQKASLAAEARAAARAAAARRGALEAAANSLQSRWRWLRDRAKKVAAARATAAKRRREAAERTVREQKEQTAAEETLAKLRAAEEVAAADRRAEARRRVAEVARMRAEERRMRALLRAQGEAMAAQAERQRASAEALSMQAEEELARAVAAAAKAAADAEAAQAAIVASEAAQAGALAVIAAVLEEVVGAAAAAQCEEEERRRQEEEREHDRDSVSARPAAQACEAASHCGDEGPTSPCWLQMRQRQLYGLHMSRLCSSSVSDPGSIYWENPANGSKASAAVLARQHCQQQNVGAGSRSRRSTPDDGVLTESTVAHLGALESLAALDLSVEGLHDVGLLERCQRLRVLRLNVNRLAAPGAFAGMSTLVHLSLRDNSLSSLDGFCGLTALRSLHVDTNRLASLDDLWRLPSLFHLSARTNRIAHLPAEPPLGFRLAVSATDTAEALKVDMATAAAAATNPVAGRKRERQSQQQPARPFWAEGGSPGAALRRLELYHNRLVHLGPQALANLPWLQQLDLGRNRLRRVDGGAFNCCPALERLVLSQNELEEPPAPLALPLLRELWLSGNHLTDLAKWRPSCTAAEAKQAALQAASDASPGVPLYADVGSGAVLPLWCPALESLFLQDNEIVSLGEGGSRCAAGESAFLGTPLLATLDLSFNKLARKEELGLLAGAARLADLQLHDNPVTAGGVASDIERRNARETVLAFLIPNVPSLRTLDGVAVSISASASNTSLPRSGATFLARDGTVVAEHLCGECTATDVAGASDVNARFSTWQRYGCGSCGSDLVGGTPAKAEPENSERDRSSRAVDGTCFAPSASVGSHGLRQGRTTSASRSVEPCGSGGSCGCKGIDGPHRVRGCTSSSVEETFGEQLYSFWTEASGFNLRNSELRTRQRRETAALADSLQAKSAAALPEIERVDRELDLEAVHASQHAQLVWEALAVHLWPPRDPPLFPQELKVEAAYNDTPADRCAKLRPTPTGESEAAAAAAAKATTSGHEEELEKRKVARALASMRRLFAPALRRWRERREHGGAAAIKVQSAFRGFHVRRALQAALESARYVDEELEMLLRCHAKLDMDKLLAPPPQLEDSWGRTTAPSRNRRPLLPPGDEESGRAVAAAATPCVKQRAKDVLDSQPQLVVDVAAPEGLGVDRASLKCPSAATKSSDLAGWGLGVADRAARRRRRLRGFQDRAAARAKEKDPQHRFKAFARRAGLDIGQEVPMSPASADGRTNDREEALPFPSPRSQAPRPSSTNQADAEAEAAPDSAMWARYGPPEPKRAPAWAHEQLESVSAGGEAGKGQLEQQTFHRTNGKRRESLQAAALRAMDTGGPAAAAAAWLSGAGRDESRRKQQHQQQQQQRQRLPAQQGQR